MRCVCKFAQAIPHDQLSLEFQQQPAALSSVENVELETGKRRFHREMYFFY